MQESSFQKFAIINAIVRRVRERERENSRLGKYTVVDAIVEALSIFSVRFF